MVKKNLKIIFLLSLSLITSSCINIKPTYQREKIEESIKKICQKEYNLEVKVEEVKDTLWIYAPFESLTDEKGNLDKKVSQEIGDIILSLQRVILSIDKPPKFYVFIASDIKKIGADLILIGFIPDLVKFQLLFISRDELFKRRFLRLKRDPNALKDKEGSHITKFNLTLPNFIALLIEQKIMNTFSKKELLANFKVKECRVEFNPKTKNFYIKIDIEEKEYKPGLPDPFKEALKISRYYISKVYNFSNFSYIKIEDLQSKKIKVLNKRALEELKLD